MLYSTTLDVVIMSLVLALLILGWRRSRPSIAYLLGPPSDSWLVGNIPRIRRSENAGDAEFEWTKKYGNAFRIKGCFGENVLHISDPKGLQYILNRHSYNFLKSWEFMVIVRLSTGNGILSMEGADHARHRRVMTPSFSYSALKGYFPLFLDSSRRTTAAWKVTLRKHDADTSVLDVWSLLGRTTLDVIGKAAFDLSFNSIEATEPMAEFHKAYHNFFVGAGNYMPSNFDIVFRRLQGYAPLWFMDVLKRLPRRDLQQLKNYMGLARTVARGLVERQLSAEANGKEGGRDAMSLLIKANNTEDPKRRLDDDEVLEQITGLLVGGHETTANSLSWALYELSRHPEVQDKLRDEVRATLADVAFRGDSEMTIADLDSMTYTIAVMKETLRYHAIAEQLFRRAGHDDIIPLGAPLKTVSGEPITAIPIRKGQVIHIGLGAYNRLPSVWGHDADEWRPERFIEELPKSDEEKINIGVFGNLASFSSGRRSCIGWRFALMEMQVVLVHLINNFAFSPAPDVEIKRISSGIMHSMVKGQESKGAQMLLTVSVLPQEDAEKV